MVSESIIGKLSDKPTLVEFAKWLSRKGVYSDEEIEALLCEEWDGAYPTSILGDDVLLDISNFLYSMAEYAVETVFGRYWWSSSRMDIRIVIEPSYEGDSYIYILDLKSRLVLAYSNCGLTWHFTPKIIEEEIIHLIDQLKWRKVK